MNKDEALALALEQAVELNRYFSSMNGVDVPERVSVPRDEWRALYATIKQALEAPVQEPAFHGFMDKEQCCVNICYTPWAPGGPNNELPTAYYTTQPAAITKESEMALEQPRYGTHKVFSPAPTAQPAPVQEPVGEVQEYRQRQFDDDGCVIGSYSKKTVTSGVYKLPHGTKLYTTQPAAQPAPDFSSLRQAFIRGWDSRGMYHGVKGTVETDHAMREHIPDFYKDATPPAAQRQWVGLTDDEISIFSASLGFDPHVKDVIRKAEAKLKEKNQ